jgi:hypothetical protein
LSAIQIDQGVYGTALGEIKLDFTNTYGQFARLHLSHAGIVD